METGWSKLIQPDRIQTDPIESERVMTNDTAEWNMYTIPSVVFRNCLFVLSMRYSLLCPSSCRFVR